MTITPPARLRFIGVALESLSEDQFRARVELERPAGQVWRKAYVGFADGSGEPDKLRAAARATLDALRQSVGAGAASGDFQLLGLEPVAVFQSAVIAVQLSIHYSNETRQLVGFCLVNDNPLRAACLAVLNGTNRFLAIPLEESDDVA